jgi:hypothetical protein
MPLPSLLLLIYPISASWAMTFRTALSVIPIAIAISSAVIVGLLAMRLSTRAWLVRNVHGVTGRNLLYMLDAFSTYPISQMEEGNNFSVFRQPLRDLLKDWSSTFTIEYVDNKNRELAVMLDSTWLLSSFIAKALPKFKLHFIDCCLCSFLRTYALCRFIDEIRLVHPLTSKGSPAKGRPCLHFHLLPLPPHHNLDEFISFWTRIASPWKKRQPFLI